MAVESSSNCPVVPPEASSPVTERNSKFSASQVLICRWSSPAGVWTKSAARALFAIAKLFASSCISLSFPPVTCCLPESWKMGSKIYLKYLHRRLGTFDEFSQGRSALQHRINSECRGTDDSKNKSQQYKRTIIKQGRDNA